MRKFRVIQVDDGRRLEWLDGIQSKARTAPGFLRLFYKQFPHAPRGDFSAVITANGAAIYWGFSLSAEFIEE